jgi:N-methylhydantoinase A
MVFATAAGRERLPVPAYDREGLRAANEIAGPAVITEMDSTVVISPGWAGEVLADGTIRLTREEAESR